MKGLLALHRIIISYKELCKTGPIDLTYNEFIVLVAFKNKENYVGSLNTKTLIDKGQLVRILRSLIKKGIVGKKKENLGHSYFLTEDGIKVIDSIKSQAKDDNAGIPLNEDEKKARDAILTYEKKLQQYTFNNSSEPEDNQIE